VGIRKFSSGNPNFDPIPMCVQADTLPPLTPPKIGGGWSIGLKNTSEKGYHQAIKERHPDYLCGLRFEA
jgi:hypothetical protein